MMPGPIITAFRLTSTSSHGPTVSVLTGIGRLALRQIFAASDRISKKLFTNATSGESGQIVDHRAI